ncbi:hypothetical protein DBR06_SOUSAS28010016, partial [Sousa chinensis]
RENKRRRFSTGSFPQNKACEGRVRAPVGTVPAPAPAPRSARRRLRCGRSPSAPTWAPTWAGDPPSEGRFPVPESTLKSREDSLTSSLGDACCRQELWLPRGSQGPDLGRGAHGTQPSPQAPALPTRHCVHMPCAPYLPLLWPFRGLQGGTRGVRLGERSPDRGAHTLDRAWSLSSWVKCEDEVVMDALASPGGVQDHVGRGSSVEPCLRTGGAGEPVAAPVAGPEGFQFRRAAVAMAAGDQAPGGVLSGEEPAGRATAVVGGPLGRNNPADPDVPARGLARKDFGHGCQVCVQEALGQGRGSRMAFWASISRLLLPGTASRRSTKTVPPRRSRVSGWSQPVHCLQIVAWIVFLILVFTTFGIFIPLLPHEWRYIAYSVTGGICLFHLLVHLIVLSIDPADANVRLKKNYSRTVPTFDRSKHAHVIQRQYCYLCEVAVTVKAKHCSTCNKCVSGFDHHCKWLNNCVGSRNYWYFFTSVASAAAGLLCMVATLLYIFTQYFINPAGLRTDPHYRSISDQNTWLLLLPLFPMRTSSPVFLGIGALTLLLELVSLLLLGHLLLLHLYLRAKKLSTFEYIMQNNKLQRSKPPAVKRDVTPPRKGLLQLDNYLRSPAQGVKLTEQDSTINIPGESSSGLQELDANLSSSTVGLESPEFSLSPSLQLTPELVDTYESRSFDFSLCEHQSEVEEVPAATVQVPKCDLPQDHPPRELPETRGAQGPVPTESPLQGSFSASRLPVESVPETHDLLSSLRGQRKDTWFQKHWDVLPSSQKPWSLESTVINISGSCQEVPHVWAMAPYTQVPKGLPVIEEEEYGMKVTPVVSVEEGCSPEEATEPGSSTKVSMIIVSEDPEPEDRAAQPE